MGGRAVDPPARVRLLPPKLLTAWAAMLAGFITWQVLYVQSQLMDTLMLSTGALLSLGVLSVGHSRPETLPAIGLVFMGVVVGMLVIDAGFDIVVLSDQTFKLDGGAPVEARRVAFSYYHTMLNSPVVNAALYLSLSTMAVGAWVGLEHAYSSAGNADLQRDWFYIVLYAMVGHAAYLFGVVSNYLEIRGARAYRREYFDGWGVVLAVRLFLIANICAIIVHCACALKFYGRKPTELTAELTAK
jgi:hypothetical protein